ncbi:MAG: hypothetical protein R3E39_31925 [Anaerolineae bacterium]
MLHIKKGTPMPKAEKQKKPANRRYVPRQTRKFQLRLEHPVDRHVGDILDFSRSQRREVTLIRDGVRLLWALENNDLSVLFELFPHLKDQFVPGGLDLLEHVQALFLKSREFAMPSAPVGQGTLHAGGPKPLNAPALAMPTFDDEDTIIISKSASSNATLNFLNNMKSLQH